jgi:predicted ATPase with chaperone activity
MAPATSAASSLKDDAEKLLETAINKLGLSARAYSRVLKVGRIIADENCRWNCLSVEDSKYHA